MPMEGGGECVSPQNTVGVSGVNSTAAKSKTIEVIGDHIFKHKKKITQFQVGFECRVLRALGHHRSRMEAFSVVFPFEELITS